MSAIAGKLVVFGGLVRRILNWLECRPPGPSFSQRLPATTLSLMHERRPPEALVYHLLKTGWQCGGCVSAAMDDCHHTGPLIRAHARQRLKIGETHRYQHP